MPTQQLCANGADVCNIDATIDVSRFRNIGKLLDLFGYLGALPSARTHGYVWPSNAALVRRYGVDVRTIERRLARLQKLGAIAIEQIEGLERRIRLLVSLSELRRMLLRGVEALASVARNVGGFADPVAGGLPVERAERGNDNTRKPKTIPKPPPVVVPPPPVPGCPLGASPDPQVLRDAKAAVEAYAQRHPVRCWAALVRTAIVQRWKPAGPPEKIERPVRVVTAPKEWVDRQRQAQQHQQQAQRETPALADAPTDAHGCESGAIPGVATNDPLKRILGICTARSGGAS